MVSKFMLSFLQRVLLGNDGFYENVGDGSGGVVYSVVDAVA